MTPSEMLTLLGYRLEDPEGDIYTTALKVLMINRAQTRVYTELNQHVIPELMSKESDVSLDSDGAFDASDLTNTVLGGLSGGVTDVQLKDYDFCRRISFHEYKTTVNRSITFTTDTGKFYFSGAKCYVLPTELHTYTKTSGTLTVGEEYTITDYETGDDFTNVGASENKLNEVFTATGTTQTTWTDGSTLQYAETSVNVWYKQQPTQITAAGYEGESFTVASEQVLDAVAYLAESMLWATNNDPREEKAAQQAANLIETLNTTIADTESNEIDEDDLFEYSADYMLPISEWEV